MGPHSHPLDSYTQPRDPHTYLQDLCPPLDPTAHLWDPCPTP